MYTQYDEKIYALPNESEDIARNHVLSFAFLFSSQFCSWIGCLHFRFGLDNGLHFFKTRMRAVGYEAENDGLRGRDVGAGIFHSFDRQVFVDLIPAQNSIHHQMYLLKSYFRTKILLIERSCLHCILCELDQYMLYWHRREPRYPTGSRCQPRENPPTSRCPRSRRWAWRTSSFRSSVYQVNIASFSQSARVPNIIFFNFTIF